MMLSKKDIIDILKSPDNTVFKEADLIRKQFVGDGVHLRGLIEFSNICKRGCLYCGLQSSNKSVKDIDFLNLKFLILLKKVLMKVLKLLYCSLERMIFLIQNLCVKLYQVLKI